MSVSISPNRYATWYQVLESLGFEVEVAALPAKTICPFCRTTTLRIYEDSKFGGAWHYCERCKSHGDMIALAARVWKIAPEAALRRLSLTIPIPDDCLTVEQVEKYLRYHYGKQQAAKQLQKLAATRLTNSEDTHERDLIKYFHLDNDAWTPAWATRFSQFCGLAEAKEVYAYLRPSRTPEHSLGRPDKHVLTIPFSNIPGRHSGYLVVARSRKSGRIITKHFMPVTNGFESASTGQFKYIDPGLAMYDALQVPNFTSMYGRSVFAGPLMQAMRLQSSHLRDSTAPLPIVGYYNGTHEIEPGKFRRHLTYDVWDSIPNRNIVFWTRVPTADQFNMAARCNGAITWLPKKDKQITPLATQFLFYLQKLARPWIEVLDKALTTYSISDRARLLQELDLPISALDTFRANCSPAALAILAAASDDGKVKTWLTLGTKRVVSNSSGWYVEPGQRLVCTGRLIIEKTLTHHESGETYYQGKIVNRTDVVTFLEKADIVNTKTMDWMQKTLLASGHRAMQCDPTWSHHVVDLAMRFQQPDMVKGAGRYGWNGDRGAFVFPRYTLAVGGRVKAETFHISDALTPAALLPSPEHTTPQVGPLLTKSLEAELFWASLATLGANLIAPALNQIPAGIGLCGLGSALVGRITAKVSGCAVYRPIDKNHQNIINGLIRATSAHSWPLVVELPRKWGRSHVAAWLNDTAEKNVVMEVDKNLLAALKVQTNWRFVVCDTPITNTNTIETYGNTILPAWLLDLCQRRMVLTAMPKQLGLAHHVLADIAAWIKRQGHDDEPLRRAAKLIEDTEATETDVARYFTQTLCRLVDEGKLECIRAGFELHDFKGCTYFEGEDDGVFVPRAVVNKMLLSEGLPLLDPAAVTAALADAGVLERELVYRSYNGWLVNTKWWESQMRLYRALRDRILRVIG